jgi:hypothetical protein
MNILKNAQYYHGDLGIIGVENVNGERGAQMEKPNPVLARGSSTGHSHVLSSVEGVKMFDVSEDEKRRLGVCIFENDRPVTVIHDGANPDHDPIEIPPGTYLVRRQREADADQTEQMVVD